MRSTLQREIAGIVLTLLALFVAGVLLLQPAPDEASCWTVRGLFGPVGACVKAGLRGLVGPAAAWLLPLALGAYGLRVFGRLSSESDRSWMVFLAGMAFLLPIGLSLANGATPESAASAGLWGSFVAFYLKALVGTAGAWFVAVLLLSALMAWTLRWNPIRAIVGPAPAGPGPAAPTLAQKLEPAPETMPSVPGHEAGAQEALAGASGERRRSRKAPADDQDGVHEAPIVYGDENEIPPRDLITPAPPRRAEEDSSELDEMGAKLMDALRTFKVDGTLVNRTTGPVVTQFEIEPSSGVKVRQFANLANDLALAMRAQSIRIVAPIPGRGAVGVEVPNPTPEVVGFRKLLESEEYKAARASLPIALGEDLEGRPVVADLARMPHLLIAGATGSGKSVCVNTIITSLIYRHTPETLRFLMVDPKMVELSVYNRLPHLRYRVITDNRDAAYLLKWAVDEMHDRYRLLAANGARNVQEFNKRLREGAVMQLPKNPDVAFEDRTYRDGIKPYIVIVIDELADLMMTVQGEIETPLALLAQKARAIGIHIILATQRPSVNVITGLIKANFPSRIAFRVASQVDSRTIIDGIGAESLLGNGDMLFIPPGKSEPQRIQGAFISGDDTEKLMGWFDERRAARRAALAAKGAAADAMDEPDILQVVKDREAAAAGEEDEEVPAGKRDPEFRRAAEVCIQHQLGSTSLLQRRLGIGYGRAARIIDQLHAAGVLGPPNGSKPREILVGLDELDRIVGE
ncbi:MAG: DNA translocase FtsK 4TM domain-containing protein [Gemmatimonadaceae bacterium]|nr:DNA translocase FtsK 4TM domain-containing protein [Gemmatimonadaceae bacterium]